MADLLDPDDYATEQATSRLRKGLQTCRKILMDYRTSLSSPPEPLDTGEKTEDR